MATRLLVRRLCREDPVCGVPAVEVFGGLCAPNRGHRRTGGGVGCGLATAAGGTSHRRTEPRSSGGALGVASAWVGVRSVARFKTRTRPWRGRVRPRRLKGSPAPILSPPRRPPPRATERGCLGRLHLDLVAVAAGGVAGGRRCRLTSRSLLENSIVAAPAAAVASKPKTPKTRDQRQRGTAATAAFACLRPLCNQLVQL